MKKNNPEFLVGLFVLVAMIGLGWLVFKTGDFHVRQGYTIKILFDYVTGIDSGSPVSLAGVHVGEVTGVRIVKNEQGITQVEVEARLPSDIFIEGDAEVKVNSFGLLGEKYIEVLPGTPGAKKLLPGSTLIGISPVALEKVTDASNRLINKIEKTVDNVNAVVSNPEFKSGLTRAVLKADTTFSDAQVLAKDLKEVSPDLKVLIKNLKETSEDLKQIAHSLRAATDRIRDGQGTIGRLSKDDTISRELEAFVKDIRANPWKLLKR